MTVCEWCDAGNAAILASPGIPMRVGMNGLSPRPCCTACLDALMAIYMTGAFPAPDDIPEREIPDERTTDTSGDEKRDPGAS